MTHRGIRSSSIIAGLVICGIMACDNGPTEPSPPDPATAAAAFTRLPASANDGDGPIETECPAGGTFTFEFDSSIEQDGDITVRRTEWTRRYQNCGMRRGSMVITANGELTSSGESHLEHEDAQWPDGVLFEQSHQVGTLTLTYDGKETHTCEYDLTITAEPAAGHYTYKGWVCGVRMDRDIYLP